MMYTYQPEHTIITFDLHGVVSTLDYKAVAQLFVYNPLSVLKLCCYSFNPFFLKDVYRLWRTHAVAARYLELVKKKYPLLVSTIPFLIRVGNAQIRNRQLIDLIIKLKARGHPIHLFSNIGDIIMDDFKVSYPDVIALFDRMHITHQQDKYVGKPYAQAFITYQQRCNPEGKQVIFIDNSKRNIDACVRHTMIGVHFTSTQRVVAKLSDMLFY